MSGADELRLASRRHHRRHWLRLVLSVLAGVLGTVVEPLHLQGTMRMLIGWNAGVYVYLFSGWWIMLRADQARMKLWAAAEDVGRAAISVVLVAAAGVTLVAIAFMLGSGHDPVRLALAGSTLLCSWLLLQTIFAVHYAHLYYGPGQGGPRRGLDFPGDDDRPLFTDFAYFSFVIGMTFQVSDVQITHSGLRRLVLVHSVLSFLYNTVLIAMTVGVAASLLGGN